MAKKQRYTEEQLLDAVLRYADVYQGKIQYSKLAKWASENIEGMEGIRDYIFQRPIIERDPKTGKITEVPKECTKRVEQINDSRSTSHAIKTNTLLHSSNVSAFFDLPRSTQIELIMKTRELVDKLSASNKYLKNENQAIKSENERLSSDQEQLSARLADISKKQNTLFRSLNAVLAEGDEAKRRQILEAIGVKDNGFDLRKYAQSLSIDVDEAFSFNQAVMQGRRQAVITDEDLMSGIDF